MSVYVCMHICMDFRRHYRNLRSFPHAYVYAACCMIQMNLNLSHTHIHVNIHMRMYIAGLRTQQNLQGLANTTSLSHTHIHACIHTYAYVYCRFKDPAEFARIGKYYATEDMIGPNYGKTTIKEVCMYVCLYAHMIRTNTMPQRT